VIISFYGFAQELVPVTYMTLTNIVGKSTGHHGSLAKWVYCYVNPAFTINVPVFFIWGVT